MRRLAFQSIVFCLALFSVSFSSPGIGVAKIRAPAWTKLLDRATKVEIVLLKDDSKGIHERSEHKALPASTLPELKTLFQDKALWNPNRSKCEPSYGGRLIFELKGKSKPEKLAVDLCFLCNDIKIDYKGEESIAEPDAALMRSMKFLGTRTLLNIFRTQFPTDNALESVK